MAEFDRHHIAMKHNTGENKQPRTARLCGRTDLRIPRDARRVFVAHARPRPPRERGVNRLPRPEASTLGVVPFQGHARASARLRGQGCASPHRLHPLDDGTSDAMTSLGEVLKVEALSRVGNRHAHKVRSG